MDIVAALAASPLFEGLAPPALQRLASHLEVLELRGGATLFKTGDPADAIFLLVSGRLRAIRPDGQVLGEIARGEPIGEVGLLIDQPRSATIIAVRDSLVLRMDRRVLLTLYHDFPDALLQTTRVMIRRMRETVQDRRRARARSQQAVAVIPATPELDVLPLATALSEAMAGFGTVGLLTPARVDAALGAGRAETLFDDHDHNPEVMTWLAEQERAHRYMVYACPPQPGAWARRCMRQTDRILLVIRAEDLPVMTPMVDELLRSGTQAVVEVLVLRAPAAPVADILGWRQLVRAVSHRYLAPEHPADVACLARGLSGRGIGLVLGGGGARGFAHLGLMRALEELQVPVDLYGGSSMGAFFAALRAYGHDVDSMVEIARQSFVEHNFLNDYLFPSVALVRGRKFVRRLHDIFGEQQIETLPRPFFCVSSNLTRGQVEVHDSGPLYLWTATSMAVPGVAPPVVWREELLVDGALLNSLPVDIMQSLQRGPVIASDVSTGGELRALGIEGPDPEGLFNWQGPGKRPSLFNIMFRTATVGGQQDAKARAKLADVYLRMPVGGVALFDWKRFDEVIEQGYEHALEQLAPLRDLLLSGDL